MSSSIEKANTFKSIFGVSEDILYGDCDINFKRYAGPSDYMKHYTCDCKKVITKARILRGRNLRNYLKIVEPSLKRTKNFQFTEISSNFVSLKLIVIEKSTYGVKRYSCTLEFKKVRRSLRIFSLFCRNKVLTMDVMSGISDSDSHDF